MHLIILFLHPRSRNHQYFLRPHIQWRMCCSGNVDVLQWNRKWFISRRVKFDSWFHMMAINEISCNRPEIKFWFRIIAWFSSKNFSFSSCSGRSRIKVDVLRRRSPPEILTVTSATGKTKCSLFMGVNTSTRMSPFQIHPRLAHIQRIHLAILQDQIDGLLHR